MPETDATRPRRLVKVHHEVEAAVIITALAARGIEGKSTGEHTSGLRAESPGMVQVWVHQQDLEQAREILASIEAESEDIDWSQVDVGDPTEPDADEADW